MAEKSVYSEQDAVDIVKTAVLLQERLAQENYQPGITEEELVRIAKEVGISPEVLERAITEHLTKRTEPEGKFKFKRETEVVLDFEVDPQDYDVLADLFTGGTNQAMMSMVGRSLTMNTMKGGTNARITVSSRHGRTRIKVVSYPLLTTIFGAQLMFVPTIIGSALIGEDHKIPAGIATIACGLIGGAGLMMGGMKASKRHHSELLAEVEKRLREVHAENEKLRLSAGDPQE